MILGLLSDTHGQAQRTANALRLLQEVGAEAFIHCGDIGSPEVLDGFVGRRAWLVCGNTDDPDSGLAQYASTLGLKLVTETPLRLKLGGRRLAVFHGHESQFAHLFDGSQHSAELRTELADCDYILYGHYHTPADAHLGSWHVISPGALQRAKVYTVATLDLATDVVEFWRVFDEAPGMPPTRYHPATGPPDLVV